MSRQFKSTPVRRIAPARPFSARYRPAQWILDYWPKFEAQLQPGPDGRGKDELLKGYARCLIWGGKVSQSGQGFINIGGRKVNVQRYAYEYHFETMPRHDHANFGDQDVHMVARCVAGGTRNCVAKGHLGLVHAREPYCHPTTPELRVSLRRRYYQDEYDVDLTLEALALKERLPEARVARILVGLEGWEGEEFIIPGGP